METETLDTSSISSSTKTTSWPIIRGSIDDSVTFESSIFAADSNSDHTDALKHKTPLILRRPSPDSGPCEITIRLAHQHEVRQVYVRSTARVYEIYSAADEKGGNEYLCTVRCGLCAQNDEPMQVTDAAGSMPATYSGSNRCEEQGHSRAESGSSINEDGWVDIDTYGFIGGESCSEKEKQDFFEATAEISDADPVMSVTLRLLSIESGDYVYIDEVYIYADPVWSEDTDSSSNMPENAFGSSLMSMLVPTLLQLSKSRTSKMQRRSDYTATERTKSLDAEDKSIGAAINSGAYQSERMPNSEINSASVHMSQREVPGQATDPQNKPYPLGGENTFSCSHIERTLNELVFRISRIEQFCLRFEENMLKPISSMEARLEKVEQQLDSFCKNAESSTGWNRISAPECHNSESSSTWMNGNDSHGSTKSDSMKNNDCCHEEILVPSSEASSSANAVQCSDMADLVKSGDCCREVVEAPSFANGASPSDVPLFAGASRLHPGLVVTAPDFSSIDDEEENDVIEAIKGSPKDSLKKPLSIDDALASALAGFLSLASTDPSICSHVVEEAAESPTAIKSINSSPLAVMQDVEPAVPSVDINGSDEPIGISLEKAALTEVRESLAADNSCEETTKAVGLDQFSEEEDRKESVGSSVYGLPDVDKDNLEDGGSSIKLGFLEGDDAKSQALLSNFCEASAFMINATLPNDHSSAHMEPQEACMGAQDATAETAEPICALAYMDSSSIKEVVKEDPDVLQNILELPMPAALDFEASILDVKFSSLDNSSAKSLEALLVEMPESQNETLCVREDDKSFSSQPADLVIIEDGDSAACEASNNQFFLNSYDSCCLPSNTEEEQQDPHACRDQDGCASLMTTVYCWNRYPVNRF